MMSRLQTVSPRWRCRCSPASLSSHQLVCCTELRDNDRRRNEQLGGQAVDLWFTFRMSGCTEERKRREKKRKKSPPQRPWLSHHGLFVKRMTRVKHPDFPFRQVWVKQWCYGPGNEVLSDSFIPPTSACRFWLKLLPSSKMATQWQTSQDLKRYFPPSVVSWQIPPHPCVSANRAVSSPIRRLVVSTMYIYGE